MVWLHHCFARDDVLHGQPTMLSSLLPRRWYAWWYQASCVPCFRNRETFWSCLVTVFLSWVSVSAVTSIAWQAMIQLLQESSDCFVILQTLWFFKLKKKNRKAAEFSDWDQSPWKQNGLTEPQNEFKSRWGNSETLYQQRSKGRKGI